MTVLLECLNTCTQKDTHRQARHTHTQTPENTHTHIRTRIRTHRCHYTSTNFERRNFCCFHCMMPQSMDTNFTA